MHEHISTITTKTVCFLEVADGDNHFYGLTGVGAITATTKII